MKKLTKSAKRNASGIEIVKIGTRVTDRATELTGVITHVTIDMNRSPRYHIQPRVISKLTGHPVSGVWISEQRMTPGALPKETVELPLGLLGTFVADVVSGMRGYVVGIKLHPLGCVHVLIQPAGLTLDGQTVGVYECDHRDLEDVPALSAAADRPSPMHVCAVPSVS